MGEIKNSITVVKNTNGKFGYICFRCGHTQNSGCQSFESIKEVKEFLGERWEKADQIFLRHTNNLKWHTIKPFKFDVVEFKKKRVSKT